MIAQTKNPHFYHFLAEGNVICGMKAEDSSGAIRELSELLVKHTAGLDLDETVEAVLAREQLMPTVISAGLAVPHARLPGIDKLLVALGTSQQGIDFKSPGMPPVRVVILIITPKHDPAAHLQVMAALAKDFQQEEAINRAVEKKNPKELLELFSGSETHLLTHLCAADIMNSTPITLMEHESLAKAIDTFARNGLMDIPILDEDNDLRGAISLEDIMRLSLPEHLLWMDDLSPILDFQPFAEMLKNDDETKIADFMREDLITVEESIPAIQLAKIFAMEKIRQIIVTSEGKFAGVVNLHEFTTKLFWE